jgi:hypothetical protein
VNHPTATVRRTLSTDDLERIHAAIAAATDTGHLLRTTLGTLYAALEGDPQLTTRMLHPDRYAIPASQWQAIVAAITNRAQAWGTAAEVGIELAMNLMPGHYDDPTVPAPELPLPDYRPTERQLTLTREAVDVIAACETYLGTLHTAYGPASEVYQAAQQSWHRNLTQLLLLNTGAETHISRDGDRSLFIRTSSGLTFGLIFHATTRRCTTDGCDTLIDDHGAARPAQPDALVRDHEHTPTYPVGAPQPGTWRLHS